MTASRIMAAIIATCTICGLALQYALVLPKNGSHAVTAWNMIGFFTVLANLAMAAIFGLRAAGRIGEAPRLFGGSALVMALVGATFETMLRPIFHPTGTQWWADLLLHDLVPILTVTYWLAMAPKGRLRFSDPPIWTLVPLIYFLYAVARAQFTGKYPYPFMDALAIGWSATLLNAVLMAGAFLVAGFLMVLLDRRLAPRSG